MKKSLLKLLQVVSLLAGLALFAFLIKQTGLALIWHYLGLMGWGFAFILLLSLVRNFARAGSWYFAIEPPARAIGFWQLMNVMLGGEAIKYLTATGPLLGEPAKAAMVRREVPLLKGFSSVIVENMIYYLSVFLFMLSGLPLLAGIVALPGSLKLAGYVIAGFILSGIAITAIAVRRRWYVLARLLETVGRRTASGKRGRLDGAISKTRALEENIYSFYENRRSAFYLILSLNMTAHLINMIEVYVILALMQLPASVFAGYVIEAVTKVINMAFFFVPTRAGVYESGNAIVLDAMGMTAAAGVALAIIRKLRAFVWVGYGIAVIAFITIIDRRKAGRELEAQDRTVD
ncbi:MAG TPA: lysylphosphatidylglycerol synthase transmembrane domain-containing protein [Blastocatellia bacterium]|nr:lysylphosphatidylglycerol synthase transmembrane domain-containing protein [Blastocatellia bacterium]